MKRQIIVILSIFIWFFGFTFADLEISNYQILWQIQKDWTINVQENIDINFFDSMHWLIRQIPLIYTVKDTKFQLFVDNVSVPNYKWTVNNYTNETTIRIWDENTYVNWEKEYNINYDIYGLIKNFSGMWYSELYWDVIGYDWANDINQVQIELTLPKSYTWFTKDDFMIMAWYWETSDIDNFGWNVTWDENKIYITYDKKLYSYEWITLAIRFPNNYFEFDDKRQESLLAWYTHDIKITNYKISANLDKTWNVSFHDEIEIEELNPTNYIRWNFPYYYQLNGYRYLNTLTWVVINGEKKILKEFDTTNSNADFTIENDIHKNNKVNADYTIYGLVTPHTPEYDEYSWYAYKFFLQLPILALRSNIENMELELSVPNWCKSLYSDDFEIIIWWSTYTLDTFNAEFGNIWCHWDKVMMTYSGDILDWEKIRLLIKFEDWIFNLNEDLSNALATIWDGQFYYSEKINLPSTLISLWLIWFSYLYWFFMDKRYKTKSRLNRKCVIQYEAPKWLEASEVWVLVDDKIDPVDLTSLIYQRAIDRYIKICTEEKNSKKFYLKKLKDLPLWAKEYQKDLFDNLFSKDEEFHFDDNSTNFNTYLESTYKKFKKYINSQNRFKTTITNVKSQTFRKQTLIIIILILISLSLIYGFIITAINDNLTPISNFTKWIFYATLIFAIANYRSYDKEVNTSKWKNLRDHCVWYKEFLVKVDKKKLETLIEQDPLFIEKTLPFAVVFWIQSQFLKKITPEILSDLERFDWNFNDLLRSYNYMNWIIKSANTFTPVINYWTSYSSSWWFSSGSSFWWWFSGGGWWWGGGWWGR